MANTDRPNGFTPVKTLSGAPVSGLIKTIGVADSDNLFIGDIFNLESGLADVGATGDTDLHGVGVGFGKVDADGIPRAYNENDLTKVFYDDSANTHTDWVAFYVPVDDVVFEVQTNTALNLAIGATCDLVDDTGGNTTTGRSTQEITTSSNGEFTVVEHPKILDTTNGGYNDRTLAAGRYYVMVTRAAQSLHA